jgi:hypothetical protein
MTSSNSENHSTCINNTRDDITYIATARLDTVEEVEEVKFLEFKHSQYLLSNQSGREYLTTSTIHPIRGMIRA